MFLVFLSIHVYTYVDLLWALLYRKPPKDVIQPPTNSSQPTTTPSKPPASKPDNSNPPTSITKPPLFALIIGINKYKSLRVTTLKGAVPDADATQAYLEKELGVPASQIRSLRNEQATRAAIIKAFRDMQTDERIKRGDPIFIFYAGHGGETEAPTGWEAGGSKIQMIIPHDFREEINGREVHGIPDRTIGALLERLAKEKGDNITVIFDSCHSGSGTRINETDPTRIPRVVEVPNNVPSDLDKDIWRTSTSDRATVIPAGFVHSGLRSHVLLAACGAKELAKEEEGRGVFTKAFLETLSTVGADKITYSDILQRIHELPQQNPQCEGFNQNRIFFNAKARGPGKVFYSVRASNDGYVMDAGAAHGITDGAEFTLYKERDSPPKTSPLGTLVVLEASAFTAKMGLAPGVSAFAIPQPAFALQTKTGTEEDLRLHVAMDEKLVSVFEALAREMQGTGPDHRRFLLVEKDKAELDIALEGDHVVFNILNTLVTQFGLTRMPFRINPDVDDVYPVIRATAHYHWHLRRTNKKHNLQNKIRLEFTKVKQIEDEWDDDLNPIIEPEGSNLNNGGVVDLVVNPNDMYGIKIINDSPLPLYPSLFFFDNSDLSITSYYQPPSAGKFKVDAPLPPKGSLTIGYGAGGAVPFSYSLREGQAVDVGFLKLFLTSEQVDFSNIPQLSPFDRNNRGDHKAQIKTISTWDTILVTVVQRQRPRAL